MSERTFILVVEDSAVQAAMLKRLLKEKGYEVELARNGREALERLRSGPLPLLVLSDIDMPEVNGYELCRTIKRDPGLVSLPVILLTNLSDPHNVIWGLQAGADNYLTKPVDPELLLTRIGSLLASPALYQEGGPDAALTFSLAGEEFAITSSRGQILNLLLSTFEGAVWQNQKLRTSLDDLSVAHRELADKNSQLEKLMEMQNRFLGMVTHDMRNPLGVILGYSRMLTDGLGGGLNPRQEKFCNAIQRSSESLLTLVNDLLEISEIESGNLRLERLPTDLYQLLLSALELNGIVAEGKNIRLQADLEEVGTLSLDPGKIEQVINNLLSNAIKYSHRDTVVRVQLRNQPEKGRVCLAVIDQGQGIPLDEQPTLFQPFRRTSVSSTGGEKSTGLGLAIVKRIVEGHGGTIELESEPGKGSTFVIHLPL